MFSAWVKRLIKKKKKDVSQYIPENSPNTTVGQKTGLGE